MSDHHQHDHDHGNGHSHEPPPTPSGYEPSLVCSHCTADTVLRCIRCKRPYCVDCLERTDAGNICFECLGLPPPAVQRRARAAGEVLRFVAIATAIALVHVFISIDNAFSNWGVILGIGVGFLLATRLDGIQRLLVAVFVIGVLASAGVVESADGSIPHESLPENFIDLLIRGFFYYLTAVVTVIAYLWQKSRF